jgi:hypothetical protein
MLRTAILRYCRLPGGANACQQALRRRTLARRALAAPDLEAAAGALERLVPPFHPGPAAKAALGFRGRAARLGGDGRGHESSLGVAEDGPTACGPLPRARLRVLDDGAREQQRDDIDEREAEDEEDADHGSHQTPIG